jgi:hypothetical protein
VSVQRAFGATPALLAAVLVGGCANSQERPRPIVCEGHCGSPANVRIGAPTMPGGGGESGETPGAGGGSSDETVTLTGKVELLLDNGRFDTGEIFADPATIKSTNAEGRTASDSWNGQDPFTVKELPGGGVSWLLVTPQSAGTDASITLEPVVVDRPDSKGFVTADLGLVRDSNIETIFTLLSVPTQRDQKAAQVILRLTERGAGSGLTPITGVTVKAASAETITYSTNGGYSSAATQTDSTGVAILLNVPAGGWPGSLVSVQFSGAKTGGAEVRAVGGAVSLVTIVL